MENIVNDWSKLLFDPFEMLEISDNERNTSSHILPAKQYGPNTE